MLIRSSFFALAVFFVATPHAIASTAVVCNQLTALAPGIIRFLVHPDGSVIAAQNATELGTNISFYAFQRSNSEGLSAKLTPLSELPNENGQGIVYDWAPTRHYFAFGTPQGKIAIYDIPSGITGETTPKLLGEKTKKTSIEALAWSNDEEHFAVVANNKLKIYELNPTSKKFPVRCVSTVPLALENIMFLSWSSDNALIALGNTSQIIIFKAKTTSGSPKLSSFSTKELDTALKNLGNNIRNIAWNRATPTTLAILCASKIKLITFPQNEGGSIRIDNNIAFPATSVLAWNASSKASKIGSQEIIAAERTGRTYQVYTLTTGSLMFDTPGHPFLPPFHGSTSGILEQDRFKSTARKHDLSETTMIELVNKLANQPQQTS